MRWCALVVLAGCPYLVEAPRLVDTGGFPRDTGSRPPPDVPPSVEVLGVELSAGGALVTWATSDTDLDVVVVSGSPAGDVAFEFPPPGMDGAVGVTEVPWPLACEPIDAPIVVTVHDRSGQEGSSTGRFAVPFVEVDGAVSGPAAPLLACGEVTEETDCLSWNHPTPDALVAASAGQAVEVSVRVDGASVGVSSTGDPVAFTVASGAQVEVCARGPATGAPSAWQLMVRR